MFNPWKTLSRCMIYENPWFKIYEDQVVRPDGQQGIYGFVEKSLAVAVVAIDSLGRVCLIGQYRYPTMRYSWEIVEGGQEKEETPLMTAKRELQEEAGLCAKNWLEIGRDLQLSNCISSEMGQVFLATDLSEVEKHPEPTEVLEVKWVNFAQALEMVHLGEIEDVLTIAGLFLAAKYLPSIECSPK